MVVPSLTRILLRKWAFCHLLGDRQGVDVHDDGFDAEDLHRRQELVLAAILEVPPLVRSSQKFFEVFVVEIQVGLGQQRVHVLVERVPESNKPSRGAEKNSCVNSLPLKLVSLQLRKHFMSNAAHTPS